MIIEELSRTQHSGKRALLLDISPGGIPELIGLGYRHFAVYPRLDDADISATSEAEIKLLTDEIVSRDPLQFDLPSSTFDLVWSPHLLGHQRWQRWALQELQRVLSPGGLLLILVPVPNRISVRVRRLRRLLARRVRRVLGRSHGSAASLQSGRIGEPGILRHMLLGLGFEILAEHEIGSQTGGGGMRVATEQILCRKPVTPVSMADHPLFADQEGLRRRFEQICSPQLHNLHRLLDQRPELDNLTASPFEELLPDIRRALVLSPHPDDELVGCGGTVLRLRRQGAEIEILQLTDGSASASVLEVADGRRQQIRLEEAAQVADSLGAQLSSWGEADGRLVCDDEKISRLVELLEKSRPDLIFTPPLHDPHPDHAATARILAVALSRLQTFRGGSDPMADPRVACYEVWTLVPVNMYSIIDKELDPKADLLMKHRHGMMVVDYINASRLIEARHGLEYAGRPCFAEGFHLMTASEFVDLAGS